MNLVPVYSNESNMFWITKQKTPPRSDIIHHMTHKQPLQSNDKANFSMIHRRPPSLLYKGVLFSVQTHPAPTLHREKRGRTRKRERWDARGDCQAPRTSSLPPSVDLDVRYCASVSHVVLSRFRKTIHSVLRHYSTDFFITAAVYH